MFDIFGMNGFIVDELLGFGGFLRVVWLLPSGDGTEISLSCVSGVLSGGNSFSFVVFH